MHCQGNQLFPFHISTVQPRVMEKLKIWGNIWPNFAGKLDLDWLKKYLIQNWPLTVNPQNGGLAFLKEISWRLQSLPEKIIFSAQNYLDNHFLCNNLLKIVWFNWFLVKIWSSRNFQILQIELNLKLNNKNVPVEISIRFSSFTFLWSSKE